LYFFSLFLTKEVKKRTNYLPDISIVLSAYNEQEFISDAIESIFSSDYPKSKITVYVGSDGSTDDTCRLLHDLSIKYSALNTLCFDRIGKNKVINALLKKIETEIVFFMDADVRLQTGVINKLIKYLSDDSVGAVIASMRSIGDSGDSAGGFGEILYQKIERIFRIYESKIYSTVNALGAFYGIKKKYIELLPDDLVADDFYPLLVAMQHKKRVQFVDEAEVIEVRPKSTSDEISRRIRATASAISSIKYKYMLLSPKYGWVTFFLFSHKILRWLAPFFLLIILFTTFFVKNEIFLLIIVIIQLYIYLGAFIGFILEKINHNLVIFKLPLYALTMSIGFLGAFFRFLSNKKNSRWQRN
jgi:cellulose synthase/poly-beta-1,6-N-acetylglucosamine synthase-like glycosyltransferase